MSGFALSDLVCQICFQSTSTMKSVLFWKVLDKYSCIWFLKVLFRLKLFFQWHLRCLRNSPSWKLLWLYVAVMLQQAWKAGKTEELKWKRYGWVVQHADKQVGYLLSWFFFFFFNHIFGLESYVDIILLTWRTVTRGGPVRKYLLEKCQEQLFVILFGFSPLPLSYHPAN